MGNLNMQPATDARDSRFDSLRDRKRPMSGGSRTQGRGPIHRCGGFAPGLRFLLLAFLGLVLGGLTPLRAQAPRTLRVTGTVTRAELDQGRELMPLLPAIAFEAVIDEQGKWWMSGGFIPDPILPPRSTKTDGRGDVGLILPPEPGWERYEQGFDGTDTYVVYRPDPEIRVIGRNNNVSQGPESALANIFPGNEFPFRPHAMSHLEWFVLSSFEYQQRSEKAGHVPSLLGDHPDVLGVSCTLFGPDDRGLHVDPLALALKVRSTFRAEWPRFVEEAEFFLDPRGIPHQPMGLKIPTDTEWAKSVDALWKSLLAQAPGTRVGRLTSAEPKAFGGRVLPTRYRLEMTRRFSRRPVNPSAIDDLMTRIELKIDTVQDLAQGHDRPRLAANRVPVSDFRYRHVDRNSVVEWLSYSVVDGRWRSLHEFGLRFSAALDHLSRPRIVRIGDPADSIY